MFVKFRSKISKLILSFYCYVLFGKNKEILEVKKNKIILVTDLYLDGDMSLKDWKQNINKILEIKWKKIKMILIVHWLE